VQFTLTTVSRATTITLLDGEGFEARHIMAISGHKSESSIRSYSRTDDTNIRQIAETISDKILGMCKLYTCRNAENPNFAKVICTYG
jgi:hypothetical protein